MLGDVDDQLVYIKVLNVVVIIDVDLSDDFLGAGLESLEGYDDAIAHLFVPDDPGEGCYVIDADLHGSVDEVDEDFLLSLDVIENENEGIVILEGVEFFKEFLAGLTLEILGDEVLSVLHHLHGGFEG